MRAVVPRLSCSCGAWHRRSCIPMTPGAREGVRRSNLLAIARRTLDERTTEAQVQRAVVQYLTACGWSVYPIGQYNAKRTQRAGVPDLWCMHDVHGALWIECKRPVGGRQSPAQRAFQAACEASGIAYHLIRSVDELRSVVPPRRRVAGASPEPEGE